MAKVYVGNLSFGMTDDGLLQLFTGRGFGPVSASVVTDKFTGRSRGFGFVELGPQDDMARAIGELNGLDVEGREIQVNEARPQGFGDGGGRRPGGGRRGFSGGSPGRRNRR